MNKFASLFVFVLMGVSLSACQDMSSALKGAEPEISSGPEGEIKVMDSVPPLALVNDLALTSLPEGGALEDEVVKEAIAQHAVREGLSRDTLRDINARLEVLRRAVLVEAFLNELNARTEITEEDVISAYDAYRRANQDIMYDFQFSRFDLRREAEVAIARYPDHQEIVTRMEDPKTGKSMAWVSQRSIPPMLRHALNHLSERNPLSEIITTNNGHYVVVFNGKKERDMPSLEEIRERLERWVLERKVREVINNIKDDSNIVI